ncbi:uncharacterized protein isoform X1 [Takifugu rubripes]|uniref:uncharacterized protein isoform X1 n=2 Tax=Takifugu rubripes TaxID=31033 RepID=UPI001145AFCB|nr:uncharacterized protein LOC115252184 isoform X1 [Takifugu rubripes]XP_029702564.1 uncharacterized protein LOC115252184 isoform X1 [Takifugu rubripes]
MEPKKQCFSKLKDAFSKSPLAHNVAFGFILTGLEKLVELEFECPCNPTWNKLLSSAFFIVPAIMASILMFIIQGFRRKELILKFIAQGCKCDEFILTLNDKRCSCDEKTLKLIDQRCSCDKSQFTLNTQEGKRDEFILKSITERCRCEKSTLKLITQGCRCEKSTLTLITQKCKCGKSKFTQGWDECIKKTFTSSVPAIVWLILLFLDGQYFTCAMTDWEGRFVLVDKAASQKWCEPISEGDVTRQKLMLCSQEWIATSQVIGMSFLFVICVGLTGYLIRECCQQRKRLRSSGSGSQVPGTPPKTTYTAHHTQCAETQT